MKPAFYAGLVLALVPVQVTLLQYVEVGGIRPDLCFVAAFLVGFLGGELEGAAVGLALGLVQDLLSAGTLGLNMMAKGAVGLVAGVAGRHMTNVTLAALLVPLGGLSVLSGVIFLLAGRPGGLEDHLFSVQAMLLPEVAYNTVVGAAAYWLVEGRLRRDQAGLRWPAGLLD